MIWTIKNPKKSSFRKKFLFASRDFAPLIINNCAMNRALFPKRRFGRKSIINFRPETFLYIMYLIKNLQDKLPR